MNKKIISTKKAPSAIGPYSQAVKHGDLIYCSGQIALNPENGLIVGNTAAEQTKQVMENLKAVLQEAGSSLDKALKCTLYIKNMDDFSSINEVYGSYFKADPPARSTIEVSRLPKNVLVEIDCIAHL